MRCCSIRAVVHESLEIREIILVLARLRDGEAVDSDVTLTVQRAMEIIGHVRGVRKGHILSRSRNKFPTEVDFHILIYVRIVIGRYKDFKIVLIDGGDGILWPEYRHLNGPVSICLKVSTNGRYFRRGSHAVAVCCA